MLSARFWGRPLPRFGVRPLAGARIRRSFTSNEQVPQQGITSNEQVPQQTLDGDTENQRLDDILDRLFESNRSYSTKDPLHRPDTDWKYHLDDGSLRDVFGDILFRKRSGWMSRDEWLSWGFGRLRIPGSGKWTIEKEAADNLETAEAIQAQAKKSEDLMRLDVGSASVAKGKSDWVIPSKAVYDNSPNSRISVVHNYLRTVNTPEEYLDVDGLLHTAVRQRERANILELAITPQAPAPAADVVFGEEETAAAQEDAKPRDLTDEESEELDKKLLAEEAAMTPEELLQRRRMEAEYQERLDMEERAEKAKKRGPLLGPVVPEADAVMGEWHYVEDRSYNEDIDDDEWFDFRRVPEPGERNMAYYLLEQRPVDKIKPVFEPWHNLVGDALPENADAVLSEAQQSLARVRDLTERFPAPLDGDPRIDPATLTAEERVALEQAKIYGLSHGDTLQFLRGELREASPASLKRWKRQWKAAFRAHTFDPLSKEQVQAAADTQLPPPGESVSSIPVHVPRPAPLPTDREVSAEEKSQHRSQTLLARVMELQQSAMKLPRVPLPHRSVAMSAEQELIYRLLNMDYDEFVKDVYVAVRDPDSPIPEGVAGVMSPSEWHKYCKDIAEATLEQRIFQVETEAVDPKMPNAVENGPEEGKVAWRAETKKLRLRAKWARRMLKDPRRLLQGGEQYEFEGTPTQLSLHARRLQTVREFIVRDERRLHREEMMRWRDLEAIPLQLDAPENQKLIPEWGRAHIDMVKHEVMRHKTMTMVQREKMLLTMDSLFMRLFAEAEELRLAEQRRKQGIGVTVVQEKPTVNFYVENQRRLKNTAPRIDPVAVARAKLPQRPGEKRAP